MKLAFIFVGGAKEPWLSEISAEYEKKLGYFCKTEIIRLRPSRQERGSEARKLADETAAILKTIKSDDFVVVCDERGEALSSKKTSARLVKAFERGKARVVIVVGGAYGFGPEVKDRADWLWSLSPLTLNHHIAQAVVLEQIYRAFAIWKNLPYHNE